MATKSKKRKQASKSNFFSGMTRAQIGLVVFAIVFGLVGIYSLLSSSAQSSKGGGRTSATLSVSPNPMKLGYVSLVVSGCGYEPGSYVTLNYYPVNAPGATFSLGFAGTETADSNGCISVTPFDQAFTSVPGTYGFKAYKTTFTKPDKLLAQTTFTVER